MKDDQDIEPEEEPMVKIKTSRGYTWITQEEHERQKRNFEEKIFWPQEN